MNRPLNATRKPKLSRHLVRSTYTKINVKSNVGSTRFDTLLNCNHLFFFFNLYTYPSPNDKFQNFSKLYEFPDDNLKFDENGKRLSKWLENIDRKREIDYFPKTHAAYM